MTVVSVADLVEGVCEWLAESGFGVYRTDTPYLAGDRAITVRLVPKAPDEVLAVAAYGVDQELTLPDSTVSVQLRFRGKPHDALGVDRWADSVADELHMRHQFTVGDMGVHVQRAARAIVAPWGADDNNRFERTDSYEFVLLRP